MKMRPLVRLTGGHPAQQGVATDLCGSRLIARPSQDVVVYPEIVDIHGLAARLRPAPVRD